MKDIPTSPTPEEIEAAAKRLIAAIDQVENSWSFAIGKAAREKVIDMFMARDDLKAAMAVRKGKEIVSPSISFKEGQIVTCDGLKPMLVTIAKNGKVVLVPKDEEGG